MPETLVVSGTVTHNSGTPVSIKVERGQRGGYGWSIEVRGTDPKQIMERIDKIDEELRRVYLTPTALDPTGERQ